MSKVIVAVALAAASFPAGTAAVAKIRVSIHEGVILDSVIDSQDIPPTAPVQATFENVADGTYTAMAQAIDADGNAVGDPVTAKFNAATPPVSMDVPATLVVTLG